MNDDDDVMSNNFHPQLREQFQHAKKVAGSSGILKTERPDSAVVGIQRPPADEHMQRFDDYYQDANNMVFHTGTFNADEDDNDVRVHK